MMQLAPQPPTGFLTTNKPLAHAQHIFGTRADAEMNADQTVCSHTERLGAIAHMRQVHGNRVAYAHTSGVSEDCDALYTDHEDLWLAVKTADCAPVLISSPAAVAAVHAGWRGLENGVLDVTIDALCTDFDLMPDDLYVALGPCISQPHYEVDKSFVARFDERFLRASERDDHYLLDIPGIVRQQVIKAGVLDIHFHQLARCTYAEADTFHSHRRATHEGTQSTCGRQLSLIRRLGA